MHFTDKRGSAAIETAAMLPFAALFLLIIVQFFHVGTATMRRLMDAEACVASELMEAMSPATDAAHEWPCLEGIALGKGGKIVVPTMPVRIGIGDWTYDIETTQEVAFVTTPLCTP